MKKFILISIIIALLSGGLLALVYFGSFKNVRFVFKQADITIDIFDSSDDKNKVASISDNQAVQKLKSGDYYYVVTGNKFSKTHNKFKVDESDQEILIDPDYSTEYLQALAKEEKTKIDAVISNAYPDIISGYNIHSGQIYNNGEWYGTTIKKKIDSWDVADLYRVILHKEDDKWVLVRYPELVLTLSNYPNVPLELLNSINGLSDS